MQKLDTVFKSVRAVQDKEAVEGVEATHVMLRLMISCCLTTMWLMLKMRLRPEVRSVKGVGCSMVWHGVWSSIVFNGESWHVLQHGVQWGMAWFTTTKAKYA